MPPSERTAWMPVRRNIRMFGAALVLVSCLAVMLSLSLDVRQRLSVLERASSDSANWVLSQAEVELLRLQLALETAASHPEDDLSDLRKRFDLLFSRVGLLQKSAAYARVLSGPIYAEELAALRQFLERTAPLFDGPEAGLRAALPALQDAMPRLYIHMRNLTLRAMLDSANAAQTQRGMMADTLSRLALMTLFLVALLSVLAWALMQMFRRSHAQAEENRKTGARLATVVNTSMDGIVVTNASGRILDFNPAAEAIFGHARASLLGRDAISALCPADVAHEQQRRVSDVLARLQAAAAAPCRLEMDAERADGSRFPVELTLSASGAGGADDTDAGDIVVGFLRDISERRRAALALDMALVQAQEGERAKAEFLAVMSHEMRTPLNGMMGSVELLADTGLDALQRQLVSVLERSGRILLGHVNGVLDISAAEAGRAVIAHDPTDLDRLIADCIANQTGLAAMAGTKISVTGLSGPLGWGLTDATRLGQIVLNLVGNAVKFTRDGSISVETEVEMIARPDGVADPSLRMVEIRVIDTGTGIAQDQLDRIFEDYVTLDIGAATRGGTGLGLGIARRLAQAMGGEIGAESEIGAGSVFWLRLPIPAVAQDPKTAADPARIDTQTPGLEVLLIEDNGINRFILRSFLESAGHRVTEAVNGQDGVAKAGAMRFDVIVTDILMPELDGVEATQRIRQGAAGGASREARILALTAHALPEEKRQFRAAGMSGCLIKPVARAALLAALVIDFPDAEDDARAVALLDPAQMESMVEQIGQAALTDLLTRVLAEGDEAVARLSVLRLATRLQPLQEAQCPEIAKLCHRMAGSAATFGAIALKARLIEVEQGLRRGDPSRGLLDTVPGLWLATAERLRQMRDGVAAAA